MSFVGIVASREDQSGSWRNPIPTSFHHQHLLPLIYGWPNEFLLSSSSIQSRSKKYNLQEAFILSGLDLE